MNASGISRGAGTPVPDASSPLPAWVDALAAGACSQDDFLRQMQRLEAEDPDVAWEALALLDQQYRLKKISRDTFISLKGRLQENSFGFGTGSNPIIQQGSVAAAEPAAASEPVAVAPPAPSVEVPAIPVATAEPPQVMSASGVAAPKVGEVLRGRYRLMDILRRDPASTLYEAADELKVDVPGVQHRVAIRWIHEAARSDSGLMQRLYRLQALSHPAIVRVFDIDAEQGGLFLSMELVRGTSLQQLLQRNGGGALAQPAAMAIVQNVADALRHAHSREIFHGEVSVANVLISDMGEVRLQGFMLEGAAAASAAADRQAFAAMAYGVLSGLTPPFHAAVPAGTQMRSPPGLSREQWQALRDTLKGRAPKASERLLTLFAGVQVAGVPGRVSLLAPVPVTARRRFGVAAWASTAVVLAASAVALFFLFYSEPARVTPGSNSAASSGSPPDPVTTPPVGTVESVEATASALPIPTSPDVEAAVTPAADVSPPATVQQPRPRIDLPTNFVRVEPGQPVARIWVRRQGRTQGEVNFLWWTETGSAVIDEDFRQIAPRIAVIPSGARGVELLVPLMPNPRRDVSRTFFVKIDQPGNGATLGVRTLMQVEVPPLPAFSFQPAR